MREIVADFILESNDKIKERGCHYARKVFASTMAKRLVAEKSDVLEARNVDRIMPRK